MSCLAPDFLLSNKIRAVFMVQALYVSKFKEALHSCNGKKTGLTI